MDTDRSLDRQRWLLPAKVKSSERSQGSKVKEIKNEPHHEAVVAGLQLLEGTDLLAQQVALLHVDEVVDHVWISILCERERENRERERESERE
jgi:hypothetical protein